MIANIFLSLSRCHFAPPQARRKISLLRDIYRGGGEEREHHSQPQSCHYRIKKAQDNTPPSMIFRADFMILSKKIRGARAHPTNENGGFLGKISLRSLSFRCSAIALFSLSPLSRQSAFFYEIRLCVCYLACYTGTPRHNALYYYWIQGR